MMVTRLALVLLALGIGTARADPPRAPRVIRLGEIVIPGRIHQPGVVYVLTRARPRLRPAPLEKSFVNEVVKSAPRL